MKKRHLIFLLFLCFGCQQNNKEAVIDINMTHEVINGTDYIAINQEFGDCSDRAESCAKINISYPQMTQLPEEVQGTINRYIKYTLSDFLVTDKIVESEDTNQYLIEAVSEKAQETQAKNKRFELSSTINKLFQSDSLISFSNSWQIQQDNDQADQGVSFLIVSLPSGEVLETNDIITNNKAIKDLMLHSLTNTLDTSYLHSSEFYITDNIGLDEDQLLFEYMPYEFAKDYAKHVQVTLPKELAAPYLSKKIRTYWQ